MSVTYTSTYNNLPVLLKKLAEKPFKWLFMAKFFFVQSADFLHMVFNLLTKQRLPVFFFTGLQFVVCNEMKQKLCSRIKIIITVTCTKQDVGDSAQGRPVVRWPEFSLAAQSNSTCFFFRFLFFLLVPFSRSFDLKLNNISFNVLLMWHHPSLNHFLLSYR